MASKAYKDFRAKVDALTPQQRVRRVWVENGDGVKTTVTYARALFMEYRGEGRICGAPAGTGKAAGPSKPGQAAPVAAPAMVACIDCGELILPNAKFCQHCGASQVVADLDQSEKDAVRQDVVGSDDIFDGQPWPLDDAGEKIPAVEDAGAPVPDFAAMKFHAIQAWCKHAGIPQMKKADSVAALFKHYGVGTVG